MRPLRGSPGKLPRRLGMVKTGCCGWSESHAKYFHDFNLIEVQDTFYQPGRIATYEKWRAGAPRGFEFTAKAWQLITHESWSPTYRRLSAPIPAVTKDRYGAFRPTEEVLRAWEVTAGTAKALGATIILFQCPASFAPTEENIKNLRTFFSKIDRGSFILAWEPRGSWEEKDIKRLCEDLELVHCVDPFKGRPLAGRIRYFRLHGLPGYDLDYTYSDDELLKLLSMVDRDAVYVMFNNYSMLVDAARFQRLGNHRA
jgi:uncharacterized protein YecE (DUF72 family)